MYMYLCLYIYVYIFNVKFFLVENKQLIIAAGVGFATAATIGAIWLYNKKSRDAIPKRWKKVGEVSELICYPIKSCGPIRIDSVNCSILGIDNDYLRDRVFMITKDRTFITARAYPTLVKIQPEIKGSIMTLSAPGMIDIVLDIKSLEGTPTNQTICWDEAVESIDCGEEIAKWISRFILSEDFGLRLAYFPGKLPTRDVREKNKKFKLMTRNDTGALHDASSFMLINENSILDLNTRLADHVTPVRFRPNFVVKGPAAYDEDNWKFVKLGSNTIFRITKPCTRFVKNNF